MYTSADDLSPRDRRRIGSAARAKASAAELFTGTKTLIILYGKEQRKMPCKVIFDWDKGTKAIIHPQTGEVIEEQLITNEDRQMELKQ